MNGRINILKEPCLTVITTAAEPRTCTLPELYELAASDRIASLPRMRAHQRAAFHAFLVQLGCIACERADREKTPADAASWYRLLTALTPEWPDEEPWHLVAADAGKPALFQPPQPADAPPLKNLLGQPDQLDMLVTSKNHDLKQRRMDAPQPEDWFFSLISLQTQEGIFGKKKYGIARMNGGYGNRSFLTLAPEPAGFGGRVLRDIDVVLADLDRFYETSRGVPDGHALLWLLPWDGTTSLRLQECHPMFIEICRRVRLEEEGVRIRARTGTSNERRVDATEYSGNVGDPWLPLNVEGDVKAMTLAADGFSYRRMAQLIGGAGQRYRLPFLARPTRTERATTLAYEAYGLVRGQGKTEGFHQRRVVVPPQASRLFADPDGREILAARSQAFLDLASACSRRVLRPALIQLFQGKRDIEWNKPSNDGLVRPWLERLDRGIDSRFFPILFETLEEPDEEAQRVFSLVLQQAAKALLDEAARAPAGHAERQALARARAENFFRRASRKHLPALRQTGQPTEIGEHELES